MEEGAMALKKKAETPLGSVQAYHLDGEIRATAQKIYEKRCAQGRKGDELSDWLEAEKMVKKTAAAQRK
jgi:hypothetical protein